MTILFWLVVAVFAATLVGLVWYIRRKAGERRLAEEARVAAFVSGLGWVGFDPANMVCPDERYVRVATGLDYTDTAPVSGMRIGTSPEMITVTVSVEQ